MPARAAGDHFITLCKAMQLTCDCVTCGCSTPKKPPHTLSLQTRAVRVFVPVALLVVVIIQCHQALASCRTRKPAGHGPSIMHQNGRALA